MDASKEKTLNSHQKNWTNILKKLSTSDALLVVMANNLIKSQSFKAKYSTGLLTSQDLSFKIVLTIQITYSAYLLGS